MIEDILKTKAEMDRLGTMLDALIELHGLAMVLAEIREICYDKANVLAVQTQDVALAKRWIANGLRVNSAAQSVHE